MSHVPELPWSFENLPLEWIDRAKVRHNEELFLLVCSASFVQSGGAQDSRQLVAHFEGDHELQTWLSQHWEHDQLQHARALAAYVRAVWPEFDWDKGSEAFLAGSDMARDAPLFDRSRGLELAARCVAETAAASRYRALHAITDEPVLKQLASHLRSDDVRHFKSFHHHFRRYREAEGLGRYPVLRTLLRRVNAINAQDFERALRQVVEQCYPQHRGDPAACLRIAGKAQALLQRHIPAQMMVRMLLKPLAFPPRLEQVLEKPLTRLAGRMLLNPRSLPGPG